VGSLKDRDGQLQKQIPRGNDSKKGKGDSKGNGNGNGKGKGDSNGNGNGKGKGNGNGNGNGNGKRFDATGAKLAKFRKGERVTTGSSGGFWCTARRLRALASRLLCC